MLKKIFKSIIAIAIFLVAAFFILKWSFSEEIPTGEKGPKAESLASKMLDALHSENLKNLDSVSWTFRGENKYLWRPKNDNVTVNWDDNRVVLFTDAPSNSLVFVNEELIQDDRKSELIDYALSNFNNDSFWLIAPS